MLTNERTEQIMEYLRAHRRATVPELAGQLFVSAATIRRDLTDLQRKGLVKRTHGGVLLVEHTEEVSLIVRQEINTSEKAAAATVALRHLPDFQVVFIDNSSTCAALAKMMDLSHKTVVTTGPLLAYTLAVRKNVTVLLPGGEYAPSSGLTGSLTCRSLREYHFDLALCSCAALGPDGTYENSIAMREVKLAAMESSSRRILVADRTKLHHTAPYRVAPLMTYDAIFTDAESSALPPLLRAGGRVLNI